MWSEPRQPRALFRTFIDGEGVQTLPSPVRAARTGAADPQLVAS
jgi:hypothetical protein